MVRRWGDAERGRPPQGLDHHLTTQAPRNLSAHAGASTAPSGVLRDRTGTLHKRARSRDGVTSGGGTFTQSYSATITIKGSGIGAASAS